MLKTTNKQNDMGWGSSPDRGESSPMTDGITTQSSRVIRGWRY